MKLVDVHKCPVAIDVLWDLLVERFKEDDPYVNISHRKLPSYDKHIAFVRSKPFAVWYLIDVGGAWVGYVSMTTRNEIGIVLFSKHRGKGYGSTALKKLMATTKPLPKKPGKRRAEYLANINPKNARSIRMFEKLGFKLMQHTYAYDPRSE